MYVYIGTEWYVYTCKHFMFWVHVQLFTLRNTHTSHLRQQFWLLPWDLICMSLLSLSQD